MADFSHEIGTEWVHISYQESAVMRDVYGFAGTQGAIHLEGIRFTPRRPSRALVIYMHPASTLQLLPVPRAMADAGVHVLCAGSRYARNDAPLVMENVLRDYGAYVRHAKEHWRYEKVVLAGWSGGGSLTAFYQSQAEKTTVVATPAGDAVDLTQLIPGDAMIWHAAHLSRAEVLADFIDPSVLDESVPTLRDPELDLYDLRNPNKAPYSKDYLTYFRGAQLARVRRRTALVKQLLHELRTGTTREMERAILTHRTLAEPRFLDASIDPNDRRIGWCFLGQPEASNNSPAGIARYSTLRAWLSQWSFDDSNARALKNAPNITVPVMVVENSADDAVPQPHSRLFFDCVGSRKKKFIRIEKADHYYANQPEQLSEAVQATIDWLIENKLLD
jgi:pimeloyl-ACP methyl ester carboxylesterase